MTGDLRIWSLTKSLQKYLQIAKKHQVMWSSHDGGTYHHQVTWLSHDGEYIAVREPGALIYIIDADSTHTFSQTTNPHTFTSTPTFSTNVRLERLDFFEILEYLHSGAIFPNGILVALTRPDKLLSVAKALVPEGHGRVDYVLTVTAHHHKSEGKVNMLP